MWELAREKAFTSFAVSVKLFPQIYGYRVYANRTQAKKIITILTFTRFSGKGRHTLH